MNFKDVSDQQEAILASIRNCESTTTEPVSGILTECQNYSDEVLEVAFGDFYKNLKAFATSVDLSHPDLRVVYDGQLVSPYEASFSKDSCDCLKLTKYSLENNLSKTCLDAIRKLIARSDHYKTISNCLDDPINNCLHVRMCPSRSRRDRLRRNKIHQVIRLDPLYKKGLDYWDEHLESFEGYVRGQMRFQRDISEGQQMYDRFIGHNLTGMAGEIKRTIDALEIRSAAEQYYGFNKISLISASIILAKMIGYRYDHHDTSASFSHVSRVLASLSLFESYKFYMSDDLHQIEYLPRLYPLHTMERHCSDELKEIVELLEAYPAVGGKPLFDHYRVLFPGVDYPSTRYSNQFRIRLPNGDISYHHSVSEAHEELDVTLMTEKLIVPILLGERDGEHFFISYFI